MTGLSMLTFVSPWWAAGALAAIGLPLLAHLLSRTRYKEVFFPAAWLVQQATVETNRVERPRHRLLMILRWLLLLLVVGAFMRPQWMPKAEALDPERGIVLVVLMDASASMQRTRDGATLYDRAVREADTLIASMDPARDVVAVVRVDRAPEALLPEPTAQLRSLRGKLSASSAGNESADWAGAFALAERLAVAGRRAVRIVVISDQQGDVPGPTADSTLANRSIDHIRMDGPTENTALRLIDLRPYPPAAGQPLTAVYEVEHWGDASRDVTLTTLLGDSTAKRPITLAPRSKQRIEVELTTPDAGTVVLRSTLKGDRSDAIPGDDSAGAVLDIAARPEILVLHADAKGSAAFAERLAAVLNPDDRVGLSLPRITIRGVGEGDKLPTEADLLRFHTVIAIEQPTPLADEAQLLERLRPYLRRGGGVVHLKHGQDVVNGKPGSFKASAIDFSLDPLRVFEGPARAGLAALSWTGVHKAIGLGEQARSILLTQDARTIVAAETIGRGRLITINADLSQRTGGLLAEPAFVVLFNELCRYASPGRSLPRPARPGDALPAILQGVPTLSLPEGSELGSALITSPGPHLALDGDRITAGFYAQLDPAESDTTAAKPWESRFFSNNSGSDELGEANTQASALAGSLRPPHVELWPYLIIGALLLAASESALLYRFTAPRQGGDVA